jgi:hypothetical protein
MPAQGGGCSDCDSDRQLEVMFTSANLQKVWIDWTELVTLGLRREQFEACTQE